MEKDMTNITHMTHAELKKMHEEIKKKNEDKYRTSSKKRLIKNVEKKFKTTMIGALAQFEEMFGDLWGHPKRVEDKTSEELENYEQWQIVRTAVLNNGNNQLRAAMDEIAQYTMTWDRYRTEFIIKKD